MNALSLELAEVSASKHFVNWRFIVVRRTYSLDMGHLEIFSALCHSELGAHEWRMTLVDSIMVGHLVVIAARLSPIFQDRGSSIATTVSAAHDELATTWVSSMRALRQLNFLYMLGQFLLNDLLYVIFEVTLQPDEVKCRRRSLIAASSALIS